MAVREARLPGGLTSGPGRLKVSASQAFAPSAAGLTGLLASWRWPPWPSDTPPQAASPV